MTDRVAIIDYGSGNLRSASRAFGRAAAGLARHRPEIVVTESPEVVAAASRVVLPGVGAFGDCLSGLRRLDGMVAALTVAVRDRGVPFLGICVGMQLMAERGLEHGDHAGFGWITGTVRRLAPADPALKVPHMGWNVLRRCRAHPVLDGLTGQPHAYFVHSFHVDASSDQAPDRAADRAADVLAVTDYGGPITAVIGRDNMIGTQFHPEKSQAVGLDLIGRFLAWSP